MHILLLLVRDSGNNIKKLPARLPIKYILMFSSTCERTCSVDVFRISREGLASKEPFRGGLGGEAGRAAAAATWLCC